MTAILPVPARLAYESSASLLARQRTCTVAVCVPARNEAATIGQVCRQLVGLRRAGAIDRVIVLDDSTDATPFLALAEGAEVVRQRDLMASSGPVLGKGDAMWRALDAVSEEVVAYVDGDTLDFGAHMAADLVRAVALDGASFVKATYRRPLRLAGETLPVGGGRVTELTAKPLLAALVPELSSFDQPLAGEIAASTDLLRTLAFSTGYGVDVGLLIDAYRAVGLDGMAQVDTGVRQNRHRPLHELAPMARQVASAIFERTDVRSAERPAIRRPAMAGGAGERWTLRPTAGARSATTTGQAA